MARAATQLGISQPAVSDSIANLESAIGVRLLERGRRGVEPTNYGAALLRSGDAVFDELRQGIQQIQFLADPTAGELRIASPESISSSILGPILQRMSERYPRIRLYVEPEVLGVKRDYPQLEKREVDLVLTRLGPDFVEKVSREKCVEILFNDRICFAADKRGPWARRRKLDLSELAHQPWISAASDDIGGTAFGEAFRAAGVEPPPIMVTTYSVHLRFSLARRAHFIAVLPESVLQFNSTMLKKLAVDVPTPPWVVAILTPKNRTPNPAIARFVECAREIAKSVAPTSAAKAAGAFPQQHQQRRQR